MSILRGNEVLDPPARRAGGLKRETRESAALILMALAVILTISFIGLAIA
jgi:hypothetical protein